MTTPYPRLLSSPEDLVTDFDGRDCVIWWDYPADFVPGQDFRVEVRDNPAGDLLNFYYCSTNHFTLSFEENTRIHSPSDPSSSLHFSVFTRDPGGSTSQAATITATNPPPSQPTNITYNFDGEDCVIFIDVGEESDILDIQFDVAAG